MVIHAPQEEEITSLEDMAEKLVDPGSERLDRTISCRGK